MDYLSSLILDGFKAFDVDQSHLNLRLAECWEFQGFVAGRDQGHLRFELFDDAPEAILKFVALAGHAPRPLEFEVDIQRIGKEPLTHLGEEVSPCDHRSPTRHRF